MPSPLLSLLLAVVTVTALLATPCAAQPVGSESAVPVVVYVSSGAGQDAPGCGVTPSAACASLRAALASCDTVAACTVLLAGDTYAGTDNCAVSVASPGRPLTLVGAGAPSSAVFQCASAGTWLSVTASNLTVTNLTVSGCTASALRVAGGSQVQLDGCVFAGNSGTCAVAGPAASEGGTYRGGRAATIGPNGAAVFSQGSTLAISRCTFRDNVVVGTGT